MAETAKKVKKKKGKTIALNQFLAKDGENGPSNAAVFSARSTSWADESENLNTEVDTSWPEEAYGGISTENRLRAARDRALLPTAPRAARGPDIDTTKIPEGPPFTAFLGNLSYDVDKDDILEFFGDKKITEVRLPQDKDGRLKGFGYAEFADKDSLLAALALNNEHLKNRKIRVDIAGQQQQERERGDRDRRDEPDRTEGDWRSKPDRQPDQNGYNERDRYYDDMGSRDRWGPRGYDSGPRRGYDDGPRDRSGYGRDRGYDDGPRGRDFGPPDRRGDDRFGERDRGRGFGSGWDYGDRDRQDDRGYERSDTGYGRDRGDNRRYGDRFGGDRDRGGGFGRERGYDDRRSGDRYGGDRFGGDRYGGERYGGDRDRGGGYGRDRNDDRRYGERDRYDDRRGGDRFGDRDRRRDSDDRDRDRDRDRERSSWRDSRDARSDFDRDEREPVKERPRLQLQPRTKPVEETKDEPVSGSSVFGGAKPVDTAAKEREIEEKLARQKLEDEAKLKQEKEKQKERRERDEWPRGPSGRARRDSNRSSDGERGPKERRDSNRRDSARSSDEGMSGKESETPPRESPRGGDGKETKELPKEAPKEAPPPAVNVWAQRMEQQKAVSTGAANADKTEPKRQTEERRVEINVDSSSMTVTSPTSPTSPDRKGFFGKPGGPKKDFRESREGGGPPRGRGRGIRHDRGERSERSNANDPERGGVRGVKKERRERRPAEPKKYEENPQPVFHTASKFSALLADEEHSEQDTQEQFDDDDNKT